MSLGSAYSIGRTGLLAGQLGIQVSGNNIANANSDGFTRQRLDLSPMAETGWGRLRYGNGVEVLGTRPIVDRALQYRLWQGTSDSAAANAEQERLANLESILNPLDTNNLSTQLGTFFNAWSSLGNSPNNATTKAIVVEQGRSIAAAIRNLRDQLVNPQRAFERELTLSVGRINSVLGQIGTLNDQISRNGLDGASGLNDARSRLVDELAGYMDITVNEQPNGSIDISVGSTRIVNGSSFTPLKITTETVDNQLVKRLSTDTELSEQLTITSGRLGALLRPHEVGTADTIARLDQLASRLINYVNRVYSTGSNGTNRSSFSGQLAIASADQTRAFNDPANQSMQDLAVQPTSGRLLVQVRNNTTGAWEQTSINIDLDGLTNANTPGYADDTSLSSLRTSLDGIANLSATINADGTLQINAADGYSVSFTEDTSGILATLGVNTYFTGNDAADIDVSAALISRPSDLNAGTINGTTPVENGTALEIAKLRDAAKSELGDVTMQDYWGVALQQVSAALQSARTQADSNSAVKANLQAQRQAVSGVSMDEEAVNLIQFQTQYQASARYLSVLQEVTQVLLQLV